MLIAFIAHERYIVRTLRALYDINTPYHLHVPIVIKSGSLSLLEPSWNPSTGLDRPVEGLLYRCINTDVAVFIIIAIANLHSETEHRHNLPVTKRISTDAGIKYVYTGRFITFSVITNTVLITRKPKDLP
jgi:hypothetical protein